MKNFIIILLMLLPLSNNITTTLYAQNPSETKESYDNAYVTDLDLALRLSKDTKQNVVLIFSASWCGFCKTLKNDLPIIKGFDNKIICIIDADKEKKLARQLKAKSLPTSILLNNEGQELSRIVGYEKGSYTKWLENNK